MNISTTELIIVAACFTLVSVVRNIRPHLSFEDMEALRAIIRHEVATQDKDASRQKLFDEFVEKDLFELKDLK